MQEERYQKQIDELTLSLAQKQEEVSQLTQKLETLKGVQETLANTEELQEKLSLLQQDVRDRNAQLDCKCLSDTNSILLFSLFCFSYSLSVFISCKDPTQVLSIPPSMLYGS